MRTTKIPKRVQIVPEIVDPALKYSIRESSNAAVRFTDPVVFTVPLIESPACIGQRTHELAHLRFTPRTPSPARIAAHHKISEHWLQVCEDARVNMLAAAVGAPIDWMTDPAVLSSLIDRAVDTRDFPALVAFATARQGCDAELAAINTQYRQTSIGRAALQVVQKVVQRLRFDNPEYSALTQSIHAAQYIQSVLGTIDDTTTQMKDTFARSPVPFDDDLDPLDSLYDTETMTSLMATTAMEHGCSLADYPTGRICAGWGKMTIDTPPRPIPCSVETKGYRAVCSDMGLVPNAMHRWCSDRAVFSTIHKRDNGGSLLIDLSGSMGCPYEQVTKYLARFPLATVATYSGAHLKGTLTILAQHGTRVAECHCGPEGNIIDGPALRWLARQPKPRTWVSDGHTTGINDTLYGVAECRMLCSIYGIKRVRNLRIFLRDAGVLPADTDARPSRP